MIPGLRQPTERKLKRPPSLKEVETRASRAASRQRDGVDGASVSTRTSPAETSLGRPPRPCASTTSTPRTQVAAAPTAGRGGLGSRRDPYKQDFPQCAAFPERSASAGTNSRGFSPPTEMRRRPSAGYLSPIADSVSAPPTCARSYASPNVEFDDEDSMLYSHAEQDQVVVPPIQWASPPRTQIETSGKSQCRVMEASTVGRARQRSSSLLTPRIQRAVEIEPIARASSIDPDARPLGDSLHVSAQDLIRCGGDLAELRACSKRTRSREAEAPPRKAPTPAEMTMSFKSAYQLRCADTAEIRDEFRHCDPAKIRGHDERDLILNQVIPPECYERYEPPAETAAVTRLPPICPPASRRRSTSERRAPSERRRSASEREHSHNDGKRKSRVRSSSPRPTSVQTNIFAEYIYISSPENLQHCAGRYDLISDVQPNGFPLWKQRGGDRWLFSGRTCRWYIGGIKEKNCDFACSSGCMRSDEHSNQMPDQVQGVWQIYVHGGWVHDTDIVCRSVAPAEPHSLFLQLSSPNGQEDCEGDYASHGDWANGFPIWKQYGGDCWIYSGIDGRWYVGGAEKKRVHFMVLSEGGDGHTFIRSWKVHNGVSPESVFGPWEFVCEGGSWKSDRSITVKPQTQLGGRSEWDELPWHNGSRRTSVRLKNI